MVNTGKTFTGALKKGVTSRIPTDAGEFRLSLYVEGGNEHFALVMGDIKDRAGVLARVHSECFTGEVLGSLRCDCGEQLARAMWKIAGEGRGVLVYLRQEGRGIGMQEKLRAYNLQDQGYDTVDANLLLGHQADGRDYTVAAMILDDLGVRSVRLMTNNPEKIEHLRMRGIVVEGRVPLQPTVNDDNARYLLTKAVRMGHILKVRGMLQNGGSGLAGNRPQGHGIAMVNACGNTRAIPSTRLCVYFSGIRQVSVREEELPEAGAGQVLVRALLSAISPGTESLIYRGEFPDELMVDENIADLRGEFGYPMKYGYSMAGQVVATGANVDPAWKGRFVVAFHPHESYFAADPASLVPVPPDVGLEDAVFLPNMETAVNFVMDGSPLVGESVVVFGQGIVGLLTTGLLATFPLGDLVALDRYALRRQASIKSGARACLDPGDPGAQKMLMKRMPEGADLVYEVSGSPAALDDAIRAAGFAGRVIIGSWYGSKSSPLSLGGRFHRSRIRLLGSQVSSISPRLSGRWTKARRFGVAWEMIRQFRPSRFVTHCFPVGEAARAYSLLDRSPGETIQVLLTYH